jgi:hypothetical protein
MEKEGNGMNKFAKALDRIKKNVVPQDNWSVEDMEHYMTVIEALAYCSEKNNIANGVTVQESDGCEYCNDPHPARDCVLPDGTERFLAVFDDGTFFGKPLIYERQINFCPMCGRRVAEPPKGE